MAKLYPPVIEGTIPAFNGAVLTVPFSMNRSVSKNEISGFALQVKTVQTNTYITTLRGVFNETGTAAVFTDFKDWVPNPGQYYKLQLAYTSRDLNDATDTIGYYSTVGVVKYTVINESNITLISGIKEIKAIGETYSFTHDFLASYDYSSDPMEKIYNYRFVIYNDTDTIEYDSGWLLHNATNDGAKYLSIDKYTFLDDLEENQIYYIQYQAITVNNLYLETNKYAITMDKEMISPYKMALDVYSNYDNGYVEIRPRGVGYDPDIIDGNLQPNEEYITGQFRIYRCNMANPKRWEPIFSFVLQQQQPSSYLDLKDFTVEHGATYKYKICQFNTNNIVAVSAYSNEVYVDFEDMFLFDGTRQLKVQYNPKVSSFKNDILESKVDTIGSKYPFFFRNGTVHYKEFPVSGLISYWVDNEELFKPLKDIGVEDASGLKRRDELLLNPKTMDLVNYNIAAERQFKLDVLEWLTNGKPKLFRSPAEGNYIVRLMNTSLTPNDTVGRMLHTFNSTAYEIDDLTYDNLNTYGFISTDLSEEDTTQLRFRTLNLRDIYEKAINGKGRYTLTSDDDGQYIELLINPRNGNPVIAQSVLIEDCEYGDIFSIDNEKTMIGVTQSYNLNNLHPISSIKFYPEKVAAFGRTVDPFADIDYIPLVTYSYFDGFTGASLFDQITDLAYETVPARQFMRSNIGANGLGNPMSDVVNEIEDIKTSVSQYFEVQFEERPVETIYCVLKLNQLNEHKDASGNLTFTDDEIKKYFTFDKTGFGRKGIPLSAYNEVNEDTLNLIKGAPLYLYKIEPITMGNFTPVYEQITSNNRSKYVMSNDYLNPEYKYFIQNNNNEYVLYTDWDKTWIRPSGRTGDGKTIYAFILTNENAWEEIEPGVKVYYEMDEYIDDPTAYNYYLSYNNGFHAFEGNVFDTWVYMNTTDTPILLNETKQTIDENILTSEDQATLEEWYGLSAIGTKINVADSIQPVLYHNLDKITNLYIGNGVLATISYQTIVSNYTFEKENSEIEVLKRKYEKYLSLLQSNRSRYTGGNIDPDFMNYTENGSTKTYLQWVLDSYQELIDGLNGAIAEWKEENGVDE